MELVYETQEPDGFWKRLAGLSFAKKYVVFCAVGTVIYWIAAIVQLVGRYSAL